MIERCTEGAGREIQVLKIKDRNALKDTDYTSYATWEMEKNGEYRECIGVFAVNENYTYIQYYASLPEEYEMMETMFLETLEDIQLEKKS